MAARLNSFDRPDAATDPRAPTLADREDDILILALDLTEIDLAAIRNHTRKTGELLGLESLQLTRFTTAVSEIARNATVYGRSGVLRFLVNEAGPVAGRQCVVAEVIDMGAGIEDLPTALTGRLLASGRTTTGIPGSRRLVDRLTIECPQGGGTRVRLVMDRPRSARTLPRSELQAISEQLSKREPGSPLEELSVQNRELLKIHQTLREKQSALEKADMRKNQFVRTLVHELRTPLATLDLSIDLMRRNETMTRADVLKRCDVMQRQTAQLSKLVEELMDAARVSEGKIVLNLVPLDLNVVIAHALEMTGGVIAAKEHAIDLHVHDEPLWVEVDESRMKQVVCNLIQNAARYTPAQGQLAVEVLREGNHAVVRVSDNGMGISAELLPHVFDLFVQGDSSVSGMEGGLGIGLTLVRHLVASHGGEVAVESAGANAGSTFTVRLPLIDAQAFPAPH